MLMVSLLMMTASAGAADRVLTIYLAGTGMTWNDYDSSASPWNNPELLSSLYEEHDDSVAIEHDAFDIYTGTWPPLAIADSEATHFKYFVNGAGTSSWTLALPPLLRIVDLIALLGSMDPDFGTRTWHNIDVEALSGLITLLNKHPNDQVILNLVGFSRGGISALRVAHKAAGHAGVKKINILAFDPVPGGSDPAAAQGEYFILDPKVNQYVGVYAEDERSYPFEAVIPKKTAGSPTNLLVVRTPGSHETMMGNQQLYGHSVGLSGILGEMTDYRVVAEVSQVIAEQLLTSNEWGEVPLTIKQDTIIGAGVNTKDDFKILVDRMWGLFDLPAPWPHANYHVAIQQTSFIPLFFGGRDLAYSWLNLGHELRVSTPFSVEKRLVFLGDERRTFGAWVPRYVLGIFPARVYNSDVVYWLENLAPRITPSTWDTLQAFRGTAPGDDEPPVPNVENLAAIAGQCTVTLSEPPKATDNVDGLLDGTTTDPLSYTEQGAYWLEWSYVDRAGNTATQPQTVIVADTLPPRPAMETLPVVEGECSATITTLPVATDNCAGQITGYTSDPLAYSTQGDFEVRWAYEDANNNSTTQLQTVAVHDITEPVIAGIAATPNTLWPPNHKMTLVTVAVSVADNCEAAPTCRITSVTSNEPEKHHWFFGRRSPDWEIVGDNTVKLRAERDRKRGDRLYTVTTECLDAVGNSSTGKVIVTVPHDQGKRHKKTKHNKGRP